jgi:phosphoribosylformylglycinamidine synthase
VGARNTSGRSLSVATGSGLSQAWSLSLATSKWRAFELSHAVGRLSRDEACALRAVASDVRGGAVPSSRHGAQKWCYKRRDMKATVYVRLKREVLDPQGDAVKRALDTLGFGGVRGVRIGKLIELYLDASAGSGPELEKKLVKMADEMLANGVIEDYEIKLG